jgi:serine/threonine protein kinase
MPKINKPLLFETTFGTYEVDEVLGEGGAGKVYGGFGLDGSPVALKVLSLDRVSSDKRKRFKNEIAFLSKNKHANIVTVVDHGLHFSDGVTVPFYVMKRFDSTLRHLLTAGIAQDRVLPLFSQILDGVEAAHLQGAIHRDLKPENVLHHVEQDLLAVADFGVASFTCDLVATLVDTSPAQRLANFKYAAPEQREVGGKIEIAADIYALGLILNEMFTSATPLGTHVMTIETVAPNYSFLDPIVAAMLRQSPGQRPSSIEEIKRLILRQKSEAVSLQRLSKIQAAVVKVSEIDEPLAETPPVLIGGDWENGFLTLFLDRPVNHQWINALQSMGNYSSVRGKGPQMFTFQDDRAITSASEHEVPHIVNHFKSWLPAASQALKYNLQREASKKEGAEREALRQQAVAEEQRLRIKRSIKI